jgi:hypothetical protein
MTAGQQAPEQDSRYRTAQAGASAEIDLLLQVLEARAGELGQREALAELAAMVAEKGAPELAGLLAAALCRLAGWAG